MKVYECYEICFLIFLNFKKKIMNLVSKSFVLVQKGKRHGEIYLD